MVAGRGLQLTSCYLASMTNCNATSKAKVQPPRCEREEDEVSRRRCRAQENNEDLPLRAIKDDQPTQLTVDVVSCVETPVGANRSVSDLHLFLLPFFLSLSNEPRGWWIFVLINDVSAHQSQRL